MIGFILRYRGLLDSINCKRHKSCQGLLLFALFVSIACYALSTVRTNIELGPVKQRSSSSSLAAKGLKRAISAHVTNKTPRAPQYSNAVLEETFHDYDLLNLRDASSYDNKLPFINNESMNLTTFPSQPKDIEDRQIYFNYNHVEWRREQKERIKTIAHTCQQLKANSLPSLEQLVENRKIYLRNILVDDKHKLLYCYVPKVACTQWKKVFIELLKIGSMSPEDSESPTFVHYGSHIPALSSTNFTAKSVLSRLKNYNKFLLTREPLERIVSGFRDKFEKNTIEAFVFNKLHGKLMLETLNKTDTENRRINFEDMLSYLGSANPSSFQEHWKPVFHLCHPCTIQYDSVGRFDNLLGDSNAILRQFVNSADRPIFPPVLKSSTPKSLPKYLSPITSVIKQKFCMAFRMDYLMFGYDFNKCINS